jgi:Putative Ig domain
MPSFVQGSGGNYPTPAIDFPSGTAGDVTAGNYMFVFMASFDAGATLGISDSQGNSYSLIQLDTAAGASVALYFTILSASGALTITMTTTGSDANFIAIANEITGVSSVLASGKGDNAGFLAPGTITFTLGTGGGGFWTVDCAGAPANATSPAVSIGMTLGTTPFPVIWSAANGGSPPFSSDDPTLNGHTITEGLEGQATLNLIATSVTGTVPILLGCGSPPSGVVGTSYSHAFPVTGGVPSFTFSITSGSLPPGLTLDTSTGVVSGTPTLAGNYPFVIQVVDSTPNTATAACEIDITGGGPALSLTCPSSSAAVGAAYSSSFVAAGGTPPYVNYAIISGMLPPGLTLNASTGLISGTPTMAGTFPYTGQVTDSDSDTATADCSITVAPRLVIFASQLAFQGVRRQSGVGPGRNYPYKPRTYTYILETTITTPGLITGQRAPIQVLSQIFRDYDFDLYEIRITYEGIDGAIPQTKALTKLWVYDVNKKQISNLPVLDLYYNGAPQSKYKNGAIVPPLLYPVDSEIRIEVTNLVSSSDQLPITMRVALVGQQRIPIA